MTNFKYACSAHERRNHLIIFQVAFYIHHFHSLIASALDLHNNMKILGIFLKTDMNVKKPNTDNLARSQLTLPVLYRTEIPLIPQMSVFVKSECNYCTIHTCTEYL